MFPSGSYGEINLNSKKPMLNIYSYWDYEFKEPTYSIDEDECELELKRLFEQAVKRQMISDVEIGSYLSGGIDSGSITAIASRESLNFKTFTCGFDVTNVSNLEKKFDESKRAKLASSLPSRGTKGRAKLSKFLCSIFVQLSSKSCYVWCWGR